MLVELLWMSTEDDANTYRKILVVDMWSAEDELILETVVNKRW